jgi:hypothetical protein
MLQSQLCRALYCWNYSVLFKSLNFFSVWMQPGPDPSSSKGGDAIQGQQAACTGNNSRDTMGVHSCSSNSIMMNPIRVCIPAQELSCSSTSISEGAWGHTSIWLYDETHSGFPRRAVLAALKGMDNFRTTTSGAAPTSRSIDY